MPPPPRYFCTVPLTADQIVILLDTVRTLILDAEQAFELKREVIDALGTSLLDGASALLDELVATNSNKTRVYTTARFFLDNDLTHIIVTGNLPDGA